MKASSSTSPVPSVIRAVGPRAPQETGLEPTAAGDVPQSESHGVEHPPRTAGADASRVVRGSGVHGEVANFRPDAGTHSPPPSPYRERYVEVQTLSDNGQATVRLVTERSTGRQFVARRVSLLEDRELAAYQQVRSQHVVQLHEHFEEGGSVVMILDYVEGQTLEEFLTARASSITEEELTGFRGQLRLGLADLQAAGVIHRDLSLSNVMIDNEGRLVIIDFGSAKFDTQRTASATRRWDYTLYYASPEQMHGEEITFASDTWSAGVVLATLAFGGMAKSGEGHRLSVSEILETIRGRGQYSEALLSDLEAMLQRDPSRRSWQGEQVALVPRKNGLSLGGIWRGLWQRLSSLVPKPSLPRQLHKAILRGETQKALALVDRLAVIGGLDYQDKNGWSALMLACCHGQPEVALRLIEKGVALDLQNKEGWSALMIACRYGQPEVALRLIEKGAALDLQNKNGWSALMLACRYGQPEVALRLIEKGVALDLQNKEGWSALMLACRYGQPEVALRLIEKGAALDLQNKDGWSALMLNLEYGELRVTFRILRDKPEMLMKKVPNSNLRVIPWARQILELPNSVIEAMQSQLDGYLAASIAQN